MVKRPQSKQASCRHNPKPTDQVTKAENVRKCLRTSLWCSMSEGGGEMSVGTVHMKREVVNGPSFE
ncbi:hypothetical protein WG66_012540, partial [Moniliophthora roreri]